MKYGYARVSTDGQGVEAQFRQLTKAGCKMFRETASGVKTDRSQLCKALHGFLNARGIFEDYTQSDLDRERQSLDQLGL